MTAVTLESMAHECLCRGYVRTLPHGFNILLNASP
ncbi:hypothetical protein GZL_04612 [Streptomyces sp. 769]|nr:hypothetical protein GZL_04612 [Streptomyces sp. 769]